MNTLNSPLLNQIAHDRLDDKLFLTGSQAMSWKPNNTVVFSVEANQPPILRLEANGDIFVKEKLVENDKDVVNALREFLDGMGVFKRPPLHEIKPDIKMWYICAQDTDGDDLDLIVRAATKERAIELWKEHFTDDYTDLPVIDWVMAIPRGCDEGVVMLDDIK